MKTGIIILAAGESSRLGYPKQIAKYKEKTLLQLAIDAADKEDYSVINELYSMLKNPYDEQPHNEKWFAKRPDWARHKVGCSMLSCSS